MSTEENKALARRVIVDAINGRRLDLLDEVIADDYVEHAMPGGGIGGRDDLKQTIRMILDGFSDFQYTIDGELGDGDLIADRLTATGTHDGAFFEIPPTGKHISWQEMHMGRIAGGKFVEHWANVDMLRIMQQLGVIPAPEHASA
ncbi:MAG TPA: ester cyclase [Chloroflexota bacterium]|nr:ester cyclase [Chloroflexota bacterium]